jgi:hypothetical protein
VLGGVLALSAFATGATQFGRFENFEGPTLSELIRIAGGLAIMALGGLAMRSAAKDS